MAIFICTDVGPSSVIFIGVTVAGSFRVNLIDFWLPQDSSTHRTADLTGQIFIDSFSP